MNTINIFSHYSNLHQNSLENFTHSSNNEKLSTLEPSTVNLTNNTVLDSHPQIGLNVHLDWVQGCLKTSNIDLFCDDLKTFFPTTEVIRSEKPKLDRHFKVTDSRVKDTSILVQYEPSKDNEDLTLQRKCLVIIPGKVISSLPLGVQRELCYELYRKYDFICSRIDIAIDDYDRTIGKRTIIKAFEEKNLNGFRSYEKHGSAVIGEEIKDDTLYLGSKQSDKFVRFYDTEPLSL